MENSPRLTVELVWEDADLEELAIVADNGQYRGVATVYFGRGDVALMANALRGFPKSMSQRELFSVGSEEADNSFAQFVFYCTDDVGHTALDVTLISSGSTLEPKSCGASIARGTWGDRRICF